MCISVNDMYVGENVDISRTASLYDGQLSQLSQLESQWSELQNQWSEWSQLERQRSQWKSQ